MVAERKLAGGEGSEHTKPPPLGPWELAGCTTGAWELFTKRRLRNTAKLAQSVEGDWKGTVRLMVTRYEQGVGGGEGGGGAGGGGGGGRRGGGGGGGEQTEPATVDPHRVQLVPN